LNCDTYSPSHKFYVSDKTLSFAKTVKILLGEYGKDFVVEQADVEKL
jgi:hypothetical protein